MLDIFRRNPGALVAAVVLHLILAVLLIVGADWFAPNEVVKPRIVQATIVNPKSLKAEVERLRKADAKHEAEREKAQDALERAKAEAEQKRNQALKEERRRQAAEARAQKEKRLAEAKREAARRAQAKREAEEAARQKAAAAAKRQAAAKAAAEARAKAEAEQARQAQEAAARAKREAAARARAEAAAAAEKKRQAQEAARQRAAAEAKREAAAKAKAEAAARAKAEAEKKREAEAKQQAVAKAKAEAEAKRKAAEAAQRARENDLLADLNAERDASEIQRYAALIDQRIRQVWLRPLGTSGDLVCTVDVRMLPGGEVVPGSVHIVQSSGNDAFDRSVVAAVYKASPLPVPSGQLFQQFREPHLTFKAQN